MLKDHPYRKLATALNRHTSHGLPGPSVLGLTASLTYAVEESKINAGIKKLCDELRISTDILTASDDELRAGGYSGTRAAAVVRLPSKETNQNLIPPNDRKPHLMLPMFNKRIKTREATQFTLSLFAVVQSLETAISKLDPTFCPPRKKQPISKWESTAHKLRGKAGDTRLAEALKHVSNLYRVSTRRCLGYVVLCFSLTPSTCKLDGL